MNEIRQKNNRCKLSKNENVRNKEEILGRSGIIAQIKKKG